MFKKKKKKILCALALSSSVKQVFKELEFLGWYTTGGPPDPSDIHVHKQVYTLPFARWGGGQRMSGRKMGPGTQVHLPPLPGVRDN